MVITFLINQNYVKPRTKQIIKGLVNKIKPGFSDFLKKFYKSISNVIRMEDEANGPPKLANSANILQIL